MDKLELKHLSCYLPYELRLTACSQPMNGRMCELLAKHTYSTIKPILRPLSDIKDSEAHHDIYCNDPKECDFHIQSILNGITKSLPYWVIEILVENHFDVFGLIPAGLAISYKEAGL